MLFICSTVTYSSYWFAFIGIVDIATELVKKMNTA